MCVIVSAHVCLFACECIGVCGSYFINVFLSHLVVEKEGDASECVCVCVSVCVCSLESIMSSAVSACR